MPALDSLQTKLGGKDFEVVAINIDTRDAEKPKNFLKEANLTRLGYFADSKAKVFQDLKGIGKALGMPTSILVDGQGCEIAQPGRSRRMGQRRCHQADQGRDGAGKGGILAVQRWNCRWVTGPGPWAKRSVPTITSAALDGGHGASAPLPTLQDGNFRPQY